MKQQVLIIQGGETFDSYEDYLKFLNDYKIDLDNIEKKKWRDSLQENLGDNFNVIIPRMPNSLNAKYLEWKIWFEKLIPVFKDNIILIGNSLGGIFYIKYLSENNLPVKIDKLILVSAPFDGENTGASLADFILNNDFDNLKKIEDKITFFYSYDDKFVSKEDFEKYQKTFPKANFITFNDRGHFLQAEFPELVEVIKNK